MITPAHPVAPEELMSLLDGELSGDEARALSAHLDHCAECAELARQFRSVSQLLSSWTVPEVPKSLEDVVLAQAGQVAKPGHTVRLSFSNWKLWAVGWGCVLATLLLVVVSSFWTTIPSRKMNYLQPQAASPSMDELASSASRQPAAAFSAGAMRAPTGVADPSAMQYSRAQKSESLALAAKRSSAGGGASTTPATSPAPMIARTVSLGIVVKDVPAARASLDSILARHHGYSAQLTATNQESVLRTLQDSLRIPAPELASTLAEVKSLGRVENESQTGEEVTQQHTDLVARLQNSRETEQRLRDILAQRTGKIEDVLEVEEEIARVRGEIEGMESEQQALEHRVDFATVDLRLAEEYKEQFNPPSTSVSNQIRNAFVSGIRNAASMFLGLVLFIEEVGPVLLIWLTILGLPGFLLWRRYRRMRARV